MTTPDSHIPLRSVELHILLSVVDRPRHGYAILQEAEERTEGRPGFEIPTLYRALRRLRDADLIRTADPPEPGPDERREDLASHAPRSTGARGGTVAARNRRRPRTSTDRRGESRRPEVTRHDLAARIGDDADPCAVAPLPTVLPKGCAQRVSGGRPAARQRDGHFADVTAHWLLADPS